MADWATFLVPHGRAWSTASSAVANCTFSSARSSPMIEINADPDSTIIYRPSGDFDFLSAQTFRQVVADLLRPGLNIVIDLRHAHDVDAVGLRALIGAARGVGSLGGTVRIVNANPRPRCLLRSAGADRLIEPSSAASPPD